MLARGVVIIGALLSPVGCLALVSTSDLSGGAPSPAAEAAADESSTASDGASDGASDEGVLPIPGPDAGDDGAPGVVWNVNNHRYVVWTFDEAKRWNEARAEAEQAGGYLATITSVDEQSFVTSLLSTRPDLLNANYGPWIGAYQPAPTTTDEPAGGWAWITGEPWSYTNWNAGEPNNSGPEHYGHLTHEAAWNDTTVNGTGNIRTAIFEFE